MRFDTVYAFDFLRPFRFRRTSSSSFDGSSGGEGMPEKKTPGTSPFWALKQPKKLLSNAFLHPFTSHRPSAITRLLAKFCLIFTHLSTFIYYLSSFPSSRFLPSPHNRWGFAVRSTPLPSRGEFISRPACYHILAKITGNLPQRLFNM